MGKRSVLQVFSHWPTWWTPSCVDLVMALDSNWEDHQSFFIYPESWMFEQQFIIIHPTGWAKHPHCAPLTRQTQILKTWRGSTPTLRLEETIRRIDPQMVQNQTLSEEDELIRPAVVWWRALIFRFLWSFSYVFFNDLTRLWFFVM